MNLVAATFNGWLFSCATSNNMDPDSQDLLIECLDYLETCDLITIEVDIAEADTIKKRKAKKIAKKSFTEIENDNRALHATALGHAVLSASLGPEDGLVVFQELDRARRALALDTDLHLIYLVSVYHLSLIFYGIWGQF